jgi:hypothetical protein
VENIDHLLPHFHAEYGEYAASIAIGSNRVIAGSLPRKKLALVRRWATLRQAELVENWERMLAGLPPLPIEPLRRGE